MELTEVQKKWVAALRSGKYKQVKRHLKSNNGFCCLGVLCDLYGKEKEILWEGEEKEMFLHKSTTLPEEVYVWAGLRGNEGDIKNPEKGEGQLLTVMNDDKGMSFKQIADFIDRNRERVFK